jgi:putative chitinase
MDVTKLTGVIPDDVLSALTDDFLTKAGIDGPLRLSNFLGQASEESGNFKTMSENLNYGLPALYSDDPAHPALWQKHFTSIEDATPYARNQQMIGNRIYENRLGNGDEASGDGYNYRGRGFIQLTGKTNYQAFQDWVNENNDTPVDFISNPDQLTTSPYNLLSAAWFFTTRNLWTVCDNGVDMDTVTRVTRIVNGGTTGVDVRFDNTQKIHNALTS